MDNKLVHIRDMMMLNKLRMIHELHATISNGKITLPDSTDIINVDDIYAHYMSDGTDGYGGAYVSGIHEVDIDGLVCMFQQIYYN